MTCSSYILRKRGRGVWVSGEVREGLERVGERGFREVGEEGGLGGIERGVKSVEEGEGLGRIGRREMEG